MLRLVLLSSLALCVGKLPAGTLLTADGTLHEGELTLDHGISVRGAQAATRLPLSAILRARFATADGVLQPGVVLVNGGRIAGAFSALNEAAVKIEAKRIVIPAKEIAWAIYHPITPMLAAQTPRGRAGALLLGGDFFEGTVRGSDAAMARVLSQIFGPRTFPAAELHALILRDTQPQGAAFDVLARDGSIYPALDVILTDGASATLRHPLYDGLRVPLAELVEIRASASRMLPLGGIAPVRVDPVAGRDAAKCFAANLALDGGALKLGIRTVDAGFECATGATVWWKPPPGAGTFLANVAASTGTPAGQKLTFAVYADGRLAGRSAPLGAGDPPATLRFAVPGVRNLALRIEGAGGAGSNGTWAEPVLLLR